MPAYVWWVSLYIAIGATAAPYLLNAWALQKVDPSTVAVYVYLQPLIGFTLAVIFLGENLSVAFGIAAVLSLQGSLWSRASTCLSKHKPAAARTFII